MRTVYTMPTEFLRDPIADEPLIDPVSGDYLFAWGAAIVRTSLDGNVESYGASGSAGDALAAALADHRSGDVYRLAGAAFELTTADAIAEIADSDITIEGAGDETTIRVTGGNLLEISGGGLVTLANFKALTGAMFALDAFTGRCAATNVNGPGIRNIIDSSAGSGSVGWSDSSFGSIGPTGLTTALYRCVLSSDIECIDVSGGDPGTVVEVNGCTLETSGSGQVAILVGMQSAVRLRSGSVTSAADGFDIDNAVGGIVQVGSSFAYDPIKTVGTIGESPGGPAGLSTARARAAEMMWSF